MIRHYKISLHNNISVSGDKYAVVAESQSFCVFLFFFVSSAGICIRSYSLSSTRISPSTTRACYTVVLPLSWREWVCGTGLLLCCYIYKTLTSTFSLLKTWFSLAFSANNPDSPRNKLWDVKWVFNVIPKQKINSLHSNPWRLQMVSVVIGFGYPVHLLPAVLCQCKIVTSSVIMKDNVSIFFI